MSENINDKKSKKKLVIITCLAGIFIGLIISLATYEGIHLTSNENFCVSCHEMRPMVSAYHNDVHGGNGKTGIKVDCVTCHLPQDNLFNYITAKAITGTKEVGIHFFGDPENIDWYEKRTHRQDFVYDNGCVSCHGNFETNPNISEQGLKMHEHYSSLLGTDKEVGCASCHIEIGHKGLRTTLNYYKPENEFYNDKFEKEKEALEMELTAEMNKK